MSERLTVYGSAQCNTCDSLRDRIAKAQGQIEALTLELAQTREQLNDRPLTMSMPLAPATAISPGDPLHGILENQLRSQIQGVPPSESRAYAGRILRPTFAGSNGHKGIDAETLGSAWNLWHNDTSVGTPSANLMSIESVPIKDYGEELIDVFFDNYWAHLPILHRPTFLEKDYYPVSQGSVGRTFSRFQVYMVFAIAACEKPRTTNGHTFSHDEFFRRAIEDLSVVMMSDDLDLVQCLLLLCLFGRNEPQKVNMWHTTGLVLRTATGLDLHRQESVAKDNLLEAEMTKRLFWSAYVIDRSMAMAMGRPLGIEDADITLPLPLQFGDEQLSDSIEPDLITPLTVFDTKDTSTFIHVIKLRRLNANIYKSFHSASPIRHIEDLEATRLRLYSLLNEWLVTAPRYLMPKSMFQSAEWFQIAYDHAVISLYRPSYASPVPSLEALRLCADSSISLISSYASLYAKNKVSYSFIALNSIFMAAITMLYSLRASPAVRNSLTRPVTETNIASCLSLFRGISSGRQIAEKCSQIVSRQGKAVLALFDKKDESGSQVDEDFLSWFGLKSHHKAGLTRGAQDQHGNAVPHLPSWQDEEVVLGSMSTPSIDAAWGDLLAEGFDWGPSATMDFFPMTLP